MQAENMKYNYNEVMDAIKKVNNFTITANKKAYHKTLLYEFKKLIDNELYNINTWLFDADYMYVYCNYKNNVNINYNTVTKNTLDGNARWLKTELLNQLNSILHLGNEYFNNSL